MHSGVVDLTLVDGDPLARALRKKMRQEGWKTACPTEEKDDSPIKKAVINGTLAPVTACFGHTLASLVLQDILRN